jgi:acyl carrier protein
MTFDEFVIAFKDAIQAGDLRIEENTPLDALDTWDSLGQLNYIAMVEEKCARIVSIDALAEAKSVEDLYRLASG